MARARIILTGPVHRRDWRAWGRRCTCGLPWRCPDAGLVPPPAEPRSLGAVGVASGAGPTLAAPAGMLGQAGVYRGNVGCWARFDGARAVRGRVAR